MDQKLSGAILLVRRQTLSQRADLGRHAEWGPYARKTRGGFLQIKGTTGTTEPESNCFNFRVTPNHNDKVLTVLYAASEPTKVRQFACLTLLIPLSRKV